MLLFWLGFGILFSAPVGVMLVFVVRYIELRVRYLDVITRIFQEKPLFIVPRGQPVAGRRGRALPVDGRPNAGGLLPQGRGAAGAA